MTVDGDDTARLTVGRRAMLIGEIMTGVLLAGLVIALLGVFTS